MASKLNLTSNMWEIELVSKQLDSLRSLIAGKNKKCTIVGEKLQQESGLLFQNQLKDAEYIYLNAVEFGELETVQKLLEEGDIDSNCVDYMGRSALLLSIKNDNMEMVELLLDQVDFDLIEDSLLDAISNEKINLVKIIIDHPSYIKGEKSHNKQRLKMRKIAKKSYRSQFSPDITPIMLAAHTNNHEIIQLLLDRGHILEMPHDVGCMCNHCEKMKNEDSLILELQRLHTYEALSSPAYLALTTTNSVSSAFLLRNELYQLGQQEKQFKEEYTNLAKQCMQFAKDCVDLCRTSDEVDSLLSGIVIKNNKAVRYPLATVKLAMHCNEKKFVAHSNCQHQMENKFYGKLLFIRDYSVINKLKYISILIPSLPILYTIYVFFPQFKIPVPRGHTFNLAEMFSNKMPVAEFLRCPVIKFIGQIMSYILFLFMIIFATFRLDADILSPTSDSWEAQALSIWKYDFRTNTRVISRIQITLIFWIFGNIIMECWQVYTHGLKRYSQSYYNIMDTTSLALYLASYALRSIVDYKVSRADSKFSLQIQEAKFLLFNHTTIHAEGLQEYIKYRNTLLLNDKAYWLRGCRLWWSPYDPELVSDCLFAIANVMSFSRVTYLMPAWEVLGPLQISLARMLSDIIRFLALFSLIVVSFVVGMTNLYWYFANIITNASITATKEMFVTFESAIPAFQSTGSTFFTLYWTLFGQSSNNSTNIDENLGLNYTGQSLLHVQDSVILINTVGSILYAVYCAIVIIILLNMLIAMMSKSFDEIQGDRLEEWKFARAVLWLVYIEHEGILPVPFNLMISKDMLMQIISELLKMFGFEGLHLIEYIDYEDYKDGEEHKEILNSMKTSMMRRYLFQLQRVKEQENKSGDSAMLQFQRQQQLIQQLATQNAPVDPNEPAASKSTPKKKGLSALLVPPSMRKQLRDEQLSAPPKSRPTSITKKQLNKIQEVDEEFTDRTEKDIRDHHLRELHKVDEELDEISMILSSGRSSFRSADYDELDIKL